MLRYIAFLLLMFAAMPAAAQATFASERIGVTVVGAGPDVVLIPGLSSHPDVWRDTVAAVPGYRYHLIHVAGFAGRPAGANAEGPVLGPVADEIARYIREAGLQRPVIVGHSMGGSWAIMVAGRNPALASKVMVVDMLPYLGAMFRRPGMTDEQMTAFAEQFRAQMAAASGEQRRLFLSTMTGMMTNTQSRRASILEQSLASDPAVAAQGYYDLIVTNLLPDVAAIRVPFLVLYTQPAGAPLTAEQIDDAYRLSYRGAPQAVVRRVPNTAHFIMYDQPDAFQRELRAFLQGS
jgi:pimeloyl-ACP methyl ester carboxylesterase